MIIKILGSGASLGIPVLACPCITCTSIDKKDKRQRSSLLISIKNINILIDIGPDFRTQAIKNNIQHIDALLLTHKHRDHTAGLDDIKPYYSCTNKSIPLYANIHTCLLYTSPSPRDLSTSRMPSSA